MPGDIFARVEGATGIYWVRPGMPLKILQSTGQTPYGGCGQTSSA